MRIDTSSGLSTPKDSKHITGESYRPMNIPASFVGDNGGGRGFEIDRYAIDQTEPVRAGDALVALA